MKPTLKDWIYAITPVQNRNERGLERILQHNAEKEGYSFQGEEIKSIRNCFKVIGYLITPTVVIGTVYFAYWFHRVGIQETINQAANLFK